MAKDKIIKPKSNDDEEEVEDRAGDVLVLIGGIILALALVAMLIMLILALIPK